jgi:hypothetical protein
MDPITTAILAALGKLAEPAVKDAYEALKSIFKRKFAGHPKLLPAIEELEARPESEGRRQVLAEELNMTGALHDSEVMATLKALQDMVKLSPSSQSVQQNVSGTGNIFSGTGDVNVRQGKS